MYISSIERLSQVAWAIGAAGPNIRQTRKCVHCYVRLCALLYQVACATIPRLRLLLYLHSSHQGVRKYIVTSIQEDRLGGWGLRGRRLRHQASTLECMRQHSIRKLKYIMRFEIRYLFLEIGLSPKVSTQSQTSLYTFAFHGLACASIQCVRYYNRLRALVYKVACSTILGCVHLIFKYSYGLNVQLYVF